MTRCSALSIHWRFGPFTVLSKSTFVVQATSETFLSLALQISFFNRFNMHTDGVLYVVMITASLRVLASYRFSCRRSANISSRCQHWIPLGAVFFDRVKTVFPLFFTGTALPTPYSTYCIVHTIHGAYDHPHTQSLTVDSLHTPHTQSLTWTRYTRSVVQGISLELLLAVPYIRYTIKRWLQNFVFANDFFLPRCWPPRQFHRHTVPKSGRLPPKSS